MKEYTWPDLSAVKRQYVVKDDLGRYGIAYQDHRTDVIFAHPIETPAVIGDNSAYYMTGTAFNCQPDGTYTGTWYDYSGPTFPATVPPQMVRRLTIVQDLGYLFPDRWADIALAGSDQMGHWNYGATLGKVGGKPGKDSSKMTVGEAEDYAREVGEKVKARAIRLAAARGDIPGARKVGRDWLIPYEGFNHYLDNRPKPGRK